MRITKSIYMGAALAFTLNLSACGQFVAYEEGSESASSVTAVNVELAGAPSLDAMEHLLFDTLLMNYASRSADGGYVLIDYLRLERDSEASYLLDYALGLMAHNDPKALGGKWDQLAYWMNAYNILCLKGVLLEWGGDPEWSVSEDRFSFFGRIAGGFGGVTLTLDQIEHGVIRGVYDHPNVIVADDSTMAEIKAFHDSIWQGETIDSRIHMAVNCASLGCPNLPDAFPFAFSGESLEAQLEGLTTAFLANSDKGAGPEGISQIFYWYRGDFVNEYGSVDAFIAANREGGMSGVDTSRPLPYDWSVNVLGQVP